MIATEDLREGDVVLVVVLGGVRNHRARQEGAMTDWRTVQYAKPNPGSKWEYRKPELSTAWSVQFDDGTYAGALRTQKWITKTA